MVKKFVRIEKVKKFLEKKTRVKIKNFKTQESA